MPKVKVKSISDNPIPRNRPAGTEEAREKQLIAKAMNLAEKQMDEGTASSQVITHFLKLGTEKAKLERVKLEREVELLKVKAESIESSKHSEELFEKALRALSSYRSDDNEYDD